MRRRLTVAFVGVSVLAAGIIVWVASSHGEGSAPPPPPAPPPVVEAADEPAKRPPKRPKPVRFTVSASGDLLMHRPLLDRAQANAGGGGYDFAPFFSRIDRWVEQVDLALCHMETPMGPGPITTYPIFNTPGDLARSVKRSGWDACSTASNHSVDGGQSGINGTVKALNRAGVESAGVFRSSAARDRPTILNVEGVKVGFVSYTDATNGLALPHPWSVNVYAAADPKAGAKRMIKDARKARDAGADAVIVQIHWGDEYASRPNSSQVAVAKKLTDAKVVSAVVGQGPHVVQPIERINGKFVVFSEGNLVSNQGTAAGLPAATQDGLIALLHFRAVGDRVAVRRVTYVPTWVRRPDYVVVPADGASYGRTVGVVGRGNGFKPER